MRRCRQTCSVKSTIQLGHRLYVAPVLNFVVVVVVIECLLYLFLYLLAGMVEGLAFFASIIPTLLEAPSVAFWSFHEVPDALEHTLLFCGLGRSALDCVLAVPAQKPTKIAANSFLECSNP